MRIRKISSLRKFKDFISTLEVEIVKFFKKYRAMQGHFKHKPGIPIS